MATHKTPKPKKQGTVLVVREFRKEDRSKIGKNYLKYHKMAFLDIMRNEDLKKVELDVLLFVYDLEFFTAKYAAAQLAYDGHINFKKDVLEPLRKKGMIINYINNGDISNEDRQRFRIPQSQKFSIRFAITQRARMIVQRLYNKLEGKIPIFLNDEK